MQKRSMQVRGEIFEKAGAVATRIGMSLEQFAEEALARQIEACESKMERDKALAESDQFRPEDLL